MIRDTMSSANDVSNGYQETPSACPVVTLLERGAVSRRH